MSLVLWFAPLLVPVLLGGAVVLVGPTVRWWLVVLAPVPALVLAGLSAPPPPPDLSWLLLDLQLGLSPPLRVLLVATAVVWVGAGVAARGLVASSRTAAATWLLTLAGNLGVLLAADVTSLYVLFGVMSFAAYGLIVHDGTPAALRAGRVTVTLVVAGELALLVGLLLAVGVGGRGTGTAEVAEALAAGLAAPDATWARVAVGLLLAGFGVKAAVVPLHVWLPLAHPAAPVAASAALSGAMLTAGIAGWLHVLPIGAAEAAGWGGVLVVAGLVSAVVGAVLGTLQPAPKVALAYSSVSQLGVITSLVGVALASPSAAPLAVVAAAITAVHHGIAKAALFVGVGLHARLTATSARRWLVIALALPALALAGAPLTSGWVAKSLGKGAVAALPAGTLPWLGTALVWVAVGTTLVMVRVLISLVRVQVAVPGGAGSGGAVSGGAGSGASTTTVRALAAGFTVLLLATVSVTWVLTGAWLADATSLEVVRPVPSWASVPDAVWPIAIGAALGVVLIRRLPDRGLVPPGDLIALLERAPAPAVVLATRVRAEVEGRRGGLQEAFARFERAVQPGEGFARFDRVMTRWTSFGVLALLLTVAFAIALAVDGSSG